MNEYHADQFNEKRRLIYTYLDEVIVIVIVIAIFLGQLCPRGKGAMRLSLCKAPTHETRPDHNTGNYVPYVVQNIVR